MLNVASRGKWSGTRNHFQCRIPSGAVLNWWTSTGTILIQGPDKAAAQLESALEGLALQPVDDQPHDDRSRRDDDIEVAYSEVKFTDSRGITTRHQRGPVAMPKQVLQLPKRP